MKLMLDLVSASSRAIRSREVLINERKFPEILRYASVIHNRKHRRVKIHFEKNKNKILYNIHFRSISDNIIILIKISTQNLENLKIN